MKVIMWPHHNGVAPNPAPHRPRNYRALLNKCPVTTESIGESALNNPGLRLVAYPSNDQNADRDGHLIRIRTCGAFGSAFHPSFSFWNDDVIDVMATEDMGVTAGYQALDSFH
jgi:hypothetical protein